MTDRWCPSEFPNAEGRCPSCGYMPGRLTAKGMIRTHRRRTDAARAVSGR